jgi:hypothetical protein
LLWENFAQKQAKPWIGGNFCQGAQVQQLILKVLHVISSVTICLMFSVCVEAPLRCKGSAPTLRFWAGASAKGLTRLHFFNGNLDGNGYRKILTDARPEFAKIFGSRSWTFQHDGAPAHSAKKTNDWLRANVPGFISSGPGGDWPAQSPDLNWIENIWGVLAAKCSEGEIPKSIEALKRRLVKAWASIPSETFVNCAKSMPNRLAQVVRNKGAPLDK